MTNQTRCIAHEIRNQISICELYSQIIKKNLEKDGIKNSSIDNALLCINRALKLMGNNLTELKTIDNNSPKIYELDNLLKEGIDMSVVYIQDKDIDITLHCTSPIKVFIDQNKFLSCITNLIKNAVEAISQKGEIKIEVSVDELVHIKIIDNGEMIPKDIKEHLFEMGYTSKKTGSGLGLAICKENLRSQNGDLKLNKSDKQNTEFEIILPVYKN